MKDSKLELLRDSYDCITDSKNDKTSSNYWKNEEDYINEHQRKSEMIASDISMNSSDLHKIYSL